MCFISDVNGQVKIAKKNIHCYKIVALIDGKICGWYKRFEYSKGKEYKIASLKPKTLESKGVIQIDKGFHSFSSEKTHPKVLLATAVYGRVSVDCVFGRCLDAYPNMSTRSVVRMDCIIPKGSEYCENRYGEIVSNRVKVVDCEVLLGS